MVRAIQRLALLVTTDLHIVINVFHETRIEKWITRAIEEWVEVMEVLTHFILLYRVKLSVAFI